MHWEPRCLLTTKDYTILQITLNRAIAADASIVPMLRRKLSGATVIFRRDVPSHLVTVNSRVLYRMGTGEAESRILVHGEESGVVGMTIPLTTPRGLALLGMSAGEHTTYERPDCVRETIFVDEVAYQPEAAEREAAKANAAPDRYGGAASGTASVVISFAGRSRPALKQTSKFDGDDPGPTAA